jgi:hypothetical protein
VEVTQCRSARGGGEVSEAPTWRRSARRRGRRGGGAGIGGQGAGTWVYDGEMIVARVRV